MSNIKHSPALDQGVGESAGGSDGTTKAIGSHTEVASDVKRRGPTGDHMSPYKPSTRASGSHMEPGPNVPGTDKSAQRGGGNVGGSDRISPTAGKSKSGSKDAQHPNVLK